MSIFKSTNTWADEFGAKEFKGAAQSPNFNSNKHISNELES